MIQLPCPSPNLAQSPSYRTIFQWRCKNLRLLTRRVGIAEQKSQVAEIAVYKRRKCLSESPHVIIRNNISYFFSIFIVLFPFEKYGYKICQVTQAQLEISLTRGSMRIRSRYKSPKHNPSFRACQILSKLGQPSTWQWALQDNVNENQPTQAWLT